MDFSKRATNRNAPQRQSMGLWTGRTKFAEPFGWGKVDPLGVLAALQCAGEKGATMSFAPGNGGVGITVRIYMGEKGDSGYCADADQLDELMLLLIEKMGSKSEDVILALQGAKVLPASSLPAD